MIFVTVGTGSKGFDALVRKMDQLAGEIDERVVIQIGNGKYKPNIAEFFRFAISVMPHFLEARVTVTAGGVGTVFELLSLRKPVVAVSNPEIPDGHQSELLERLAGERYLKWCRTLDELRSLLESGSLPQMRVYEPPACWIDRVVLEHVASYVRTPTSLDQRRR
jgi:UDP-N-acetylglucosamine transferase subunit ALG13